MSTLDAQAILPTHTGTVYQEGPLGLRENRQDGVVSHGASILGIPHDLMDHIELGQSPLQHLTGLAAPFCWPDPCPLLNVPFLLSRAMVPPPSSFRTKLGLRLPS